MAGFDSPSIPDAIPPDPLSPFPYALYCMEGCAWGLIQGGTGRRVVPIRWQRLTAGAEVSVDAVASYAQSEGVHIQEHWETKKGELFAGIVRLCREFGFTGESTCDHIHRVVESLSPEPFDP